MITNENLTITSDTPFVIDGNEPQILVFGSITLAPGAEMRIFSDVTINVDTLTFQGNNTIRVLGVNGQNAVVGSADLNGGNGTDTPNVRINALNFSGDVVLSMIAGSGGNGADGSPNGGNGGNAGNGNYCVFSYGSMGANSSIIPEVEMAFGGIGGNGIQQANSKIQPQNGTNGRDGQAGTIIVNPNN